MATAQLGIREVVPGQDNVTVSINQGNDTLDNSENRATSIATGDANVTLTTAQQMTNGFLDFTGAMTANRDVYVVPSLSRSFSVRNSTTGGFNLVFRYLIGGATVSLGGGLSAALHCDGTDVILVGKDSAGGTATGVTFTPSQTISSQNVQDAIGELSAGQTQDLSIAITGNRILTVDEFTDNVYIELTGTPSADFTFKTPQVQPLTYDSGLINGTFETGSLTGWTVSAGNAAAVTSHGTITGPHNGTYFAILNGNGNQVSTLEQLMDLTGLPDFSASNVDAGSVNVDFDAWRNGNGSFSCTRATARIRVQAFTGADAFISNVYDSGLENPGCSTWILRSNNGTLPATTRKLKVLFDNTNSVHIVGFDDVTLLLDDFAAGGLSNKGFLIIKNTTGKTATVSVDQGAGSSVVIPEDQTRLIYSDGDNIIDLSADPIHTSIPIPSGQTITLQGTLQAVEPATGDDLHVEIFAGAKNVAGTSTLTGKMFKDNTSGGAASWDFDVDVDDTGDTFRVLFTGEAAHTINVTFDYTVTLRG
jgi:hypothetical protein